MNTGYDYTALVDNAMRGVVRDVLRDVQQHGLTDPHHFFITFRTDFPGVVISEALRSKYPSEITIVLQHQFRELRVEQEVFKIVLSFNNIPEKLVIPFAALTAFADPSVKFGLQFHLAEDDAAFPAVPSSITPPITSAEVKSATVPQEPEREGAAKIITLDAFRKK